MKRLYLLSIPILLIFNIINLSSGDLRLLGTFAIVIIFAILGLRQSKYKSVLGLISLIILTDFIIRILIDKIGGHLTITDEGQNVPLIIQFKAQVLELIGSMAIVSILGIFKYFFNKQKKS